jgi:urease
MQHGKTLLGRRNVYPGVETLIHDIQVEGTFPDGCDSAVTLTRERTDLPCRVFLVTVHDPICTEFGNLADALYGSFLPVPSE